MQKSAFRSASHLRNNLAERGTPCAILNGRTLLETLDLLQTPHVRWCCSERYCGATLHFDPMIRTIRPALNLSESLAETGKI